MRSLQATTMNRRSFLLGSAAAVVAPALPKIVALPVAFPEPSPTALEILAFQKALLRAIEDLFIYGNATFIERRLIGVYQNVPIYEVENINLKVLSEMVRRKIDV